MPWQERPEGCKDVMWRYSQKSNHWAISHPNFQ
ncbi:hypothetical protein CCAN11_2070004 [Capnocytophaga canimorsus]|uniref:Uncharacterized protein n=1 Tax=Capnocytophaga canimorsus TaxID=28188 RepID=A0A0B7IE51_9FLAO|nr:hypothetical protein CCAN11_2070004 [Capnocytophaga canimorsus]